MAVAAVSNASTCALAQAGSTINLFLPMGNSSGELAASVVTNVPEATVYVITCATQQGTACGTGCQLQSAMTMTQGVRTLDLTWTDPQAELAVSSISSLASVQPEDITTINCELYGGSTATSRSAVCTGQSLLAGLGNGSETTTLAYSQVQYVPVTITAGALAEETGASGRGSASSATPSSAGSAVATVGGSLARYAVAGVVVGIGAVALL